MERATAAACSRWPAWVNTPASTASAYGCWSGSVVERPTVSAWAATLAACSCWPAVGDVVAVAGKSEGGGEVGDVPGGDQVKSNGDLVQGGGIPASDVKHSLVPGGVSGTGRQPSGVAGDDQRPEVAAQQVFRGAAIPAAIIAAIKDTGYLHDWDDADSVRILAACRRAMAVDGRVLIVERLIPHNPADAVPVLLSDLNMLILTGGQERTNAEYGQLLAEAGLSLAKVQPITPPYGVIEAVPS